MFIKPTSPEVRVPDPSQAGTPDYFLTAEGREVEPSMYWTRRLRDGDIFVSTPAGAAPEPETPSTPAP